MINTIIILKKWDMKTPEISYCIRYKLFIYVFFNNLPVFKKFGHFIRPIAIN